MGRSDRVTILWLRLSGFLSSADRGIFNHGISDRDIVGKAFGG